MRRPKRLGSRKKRPSGRFFFQCHVAQYGARRFEILVFNLRRWVIIAMLVFGPWRISSFEWLTDIHEASTEGQRNERSDETGFRPFRRVAA